MLVALAGWQTRTHDKRIEKQGSYFSGETAQSNQVKPIVAVNVRPFFLAALEKPGLVALRTRAWASSKGSQAFY